MTNSLLAISQACLAISIIFMIRGNARLSQRIKDLEYKSFLLEEKITELEAEETRCPDCAYKELCPAYETGVAYPCKHFKQEETE